MRSVSAEVADGLGGVGVSGEIRSDDVHWQSRSLWLSSDGGACPSVAACAGSAASPKGHARFRDGYSRRHGDPRHRLQWPAIRRDESPEIVARLTSVDRHADVDAAIRDGAEMRGGLVDLNRVALVVERREDRGQIVVLRRGLQVVQQLVERAAARRGIEEAGRGDGCATPDEQVGGAAGALDGIATGTSRVTVLPSDDVSVPRTTSGRRG